jgi:hypothetical protein
MEILDRETKDTPYSSVDTVRKFKSIHPDTEFYFVMGTDAFAEFKSWPKARELSEEATIVVVSRNGYPIDWSDVKKYGGVVIREDPMLELELDLNPPHDIKGYMRDNELYGMVKPAPLPEQPKPAAEQPKPQQQQPKPQQQSNQPRPQQNNHHHHNKNKHKHNNQQGNRPQKQNLNKKAEGNK